MNMAAILVMWHKPIVFTFIPPSHEGPTWNLASIGLGVSKEKKFETVEYEWHWTKVNEWPWPLIFIKLQVLIWLTASTNLDIIDYNGFWKIHCFKIFPYKVNPGSSFEETWKYSSIQWCIPNFKVIGLLVPEKKIFKGFTIYGHGDHLGHVTRTFWTNFRSLIP